MEGQEEVKYVWVTAGRKQIYVHQMSTLHIRRTIKMLQGKGKQPIPDMYFETKDQWIELFNKELKKRDESNQNRRGSA